MIQWLHWESRPDVHEPMHDATACARPTLHASTRQATIGGAILYFETMRSETRDVDPMTANTSIPFENAPPADAGALGVREGAVSPAMIELADVVFRGRMALRGDHPDRVTRGEVIRPRGAGLLGYQPIEAGSRTGAESDREDRTP